MHISFININIRISNTFGFLIKRQAYHKQSVYHTEHKLYFNSFIFPILFHPTPLHFILFVSFRFLFHSIPFIFSSLFLFNFFSVLFCVLLPPLHSIPFHFILFCYTFYYIHLLRIHYTDGSQ